MQIDLHKVALLEEGIVETHIPSLVEALDQLHTAVAQLDYTNRKIFFSKTVRSRLNEMAKIVGAALFD